MSAPLMVFMPAWLDDAGLTPVQMRVYVHLARRGDTWSSAATIADICRINRKSVFSALAALEKMGLIRRESRAGETTLITLVQTNEVHSPVPNEAPTAVSTRGSKGYGGVPIETPPPVPFGIPQRVSHEGYPLRKPRLSHDTKPRKRQPIPGNDVPLAFGSESFASAWSEWESYRREARKTLTPLTRRMQMKELSSVPENIAIDALRTAITKGWTGFWIGKSRESSHLSTGTQFLAANVTL